MPRRVLRVVLEGLAAVQRPPDISVREVHENDSPQLAALMFAAYQGSVDKEAQTLEIATTEVALSFQGEYGPMIRGACLGALRGHALLAASIVTRWRGAPLLAFIVTDPASKRQGLGQRVLEESMARLAGLGESELLLVVTPGNTPAERLYEKLGFHDTDASRVRSDR